MDRKFIVACSLGVILAISTSFLYTQNTNLREELIQVEAKSDVQSVVKVPQKIAVSAGNKESGSSSEGESKDTSEESSEAIVENEVEDVDFEGEGDIFLKQDILLYVDSLVNHFFIVENVADRNKALKEMVNETIYQEIEVPDDYHLTVKGEVEINDEKVYFSDLTKDKAVLLVYLDMVIGNIPQKMLGHITINHTDEGWIAEELSFEGIVSSPN